MNADLHFLSLWASQWLMTFNPTKTESLSFNTSHPIPLYLNRVPITEVTTQCHLGLTFSSDMSWKDHITNVTERVSKRLGMLHYLKFKLPRSCLEHMYKTMILPIFDYCDIVYDSCVMAHKRTLETCHMRAAKIVTGALPSTNSERLLSDELGWTDLSTRRNQHKLRYMYKIMNNQTPYYLCDILAPQRPPAVGYTLRRPLDAMPYFCKSEKYKRSFFPSTVLLWNRQTEVLKNSESLATFKLRLEQATSPSRPPSHFSTGSRYLSVLLTRLRLDHSQLNDHLFRVGLVDSPACQCGYSRETVIHFLFECNLYRNSRTQLIHKLHSVLAPQLNIHQIIQSSKVRASKLVLNGTPLLSNSDNVKLFHYITSYIADSGRFS